MGRNSFLEGVIAFAMLALFLSCFGFSACGQSETAFIPTDKFDILGNNSSISFAVNGTYEQASLENGVWSFVNLRLNNSQNAEKLSLKVSAKNSMVIITSCLIYNSTFAGERARGARLRYNVIGQGTQVFDLGLDTEGGYWGVNLNGVFIGENHGWSLSPNGTLTVAGATGNVTLFYYGFPGSLGDNADGFDQPFLNQHSLVIITTFVVVTIVLLAVAVRARRKELK